MSHKMVNRTFNANMILHTRNCNLTHHTRTALIILFHIMIYNASNSILILQCDVSYIGGAEGEVAARECWRANQLKKKQKEQEIGKRKVPCEKTGVKKRVDREKGVVIQ